MIKYILDSETVNSRFSGASWYEESLKKKISIYGCGGIGSHTALGISKIFSESILYLFDFDKVSISNIGGQMFDSFQCGESKVTAVKDNLEVYEGTNSNSYIAFESDAYNVSDIFITALDNMTARKKIFNSIHRKFNDTNRLYIDARMSADTIQVIAFKLNEKDKIKHYKKNFLFKDSEATHEICSYKQTFFMGQMISGFIGSIVTNYLTTLSEDNFPQVVPYFTEFSSPLMSYNNVIQC